MTPYFLLKFFHVLGAIVILGTGTGIAFFMLMAHRTLVKTGPAIVRMSRCSSWISADEQVARR